MCVAITRRGAHVTPPFVDDVREGVKTTPLARNDDVSIQTVPFGATRGIDPLSPNPGRERNAGFGLDHAVCVPSARASACDS
jgi:hypothetical protein